MRGSVANALNAQRCMSLSIVSTVTREILNRDKHKIINLKGMMVGNPYVDPYTNTMTMFEAWYHHGLLPRPLYNQFTRKCSNPNAYTNGKCHDYILDMYRARGKGINMYALNFPVCVTTDEKNGENAGEKRKRRDRQLLSNEESSSANSIMISAQATHLMNSTLNAMSEVNAKYNDPPFLTPGDHCFPCAEQNLIRYLNRPAVVRAIHAKPDALPWTACSSKVNYSKKDYLSIQKKVYSTLLDTMNDGSINLDMLIYSGDDDSVCSLAGTQTWIWDLGIKPKKYWEPWVVANQTAGYLTRFRIKNKKSSFVFATVHGAGHEVPSYMPREALELFRRYLQQDWKV